MNIPKSELTRFATMVSGQAQRFGLQPEDYLRKVWYHEEAPRLGEYVAMVLLDQLLALMPKQPLEEE